MHQKLRKILPCNLFSVLNSEQTINYITGVYLGTVFFPDEELYEKFSEFGIKRQNWKMDD